MGRNCANIPNVDCSQRNTINWLIPGWKVKAKVNVCMTGMLIKYQIERLIGNSASVYRNLLKRKTLGLWVWGRDFGWHCPGMRKECKLMFKQMLNKNSITVLQVMLKISTIRTKLNTVDFLPLHAFVLLRLKLLGV